MEKQEHRFKNGRYVKLPPELMDSEIYRGLSGKHMWVLNRFYQKIKWTPSPKRAARLRLSDIRNNGEIIFSYREAIEYGVTRSTFAKAIKKLVEKGFIDITRQGGHYGNMPTHYSISDRWKKYDTPDFKEVKKDRTLPTGLGFQKGDKHYSKQK